MRIISGQYRGKKLNTPPESSGVRPTTDRAKEALFNILFDKINVDCVFLDLFSGSGAIGIEALSRGVKKVYFVDNNNKSMELLKKNLEGIRGNYELFNMDYKKALNLIANSGQLIDVAFCDPPYNENLGQSILDTIGQAKVINYSGTIVIERNKEFDTAPTNYYNHYDKRVYALSCFDFYKREKKCAVTGTFDPFTKGHIDLVKKAKEMFDKVYVVILINDKKTIRYSLEKRMDIIRIAIETIKDNVIIDSYDGLTIDYCNKNDIQYILRGVRNSDDMLYEQQMAEYNYKNGGVTTLIMPAKDSQISSTLLKENLDKNKDITAFVDKNIIKILKE